MMMQDFKRSPLKWAVLACTAVALAGATMSSGQHALKVTFGNRGVQTVAYAGQTLEDLNQFPADGFQIGHMKVTDLSGQTLTGQDYTWGENNKGKTWNASTHTWTYRYVWGTIVVQFIVHGDSLDAQVTETNNTGSGVIVSGVSIAPLVLHFPVLPKAFVDPAYSQLTINLSSPGVKLADFGTGEVAAVAPDAAAAIYSGFQPAATPNAYVPLISSTTPDNVPDFMPRSDQQLKPGDTETFLVSLRFAPTGTPIGSLAADAFSNWASTWPQQLHWSDRRAIGTVYLASSVSGDKRTPSGFPNNPRRYFSESNSDAFDIRTDAGLAKFQVRVLQQATDTVVNLQRLNAQGAIVWDIEGEEYPMDTSYLCSPDQIGTFAPEMESTVKDAQSPYAGMRLADAFFKTISSAGFRVGVCVRPQMLIRHSDGTADQTYISSAAVAANLIGKMKYAHARWGATLFYIDSSVDATGAPLSADLMQQAAAALPDSLLIPEESTPKGYAYAAPFRTFIFHGDTGTDPSIWNFYPNAFSAILINDADPAALAAHQTDLTASVAHGDILMAHATYWQANNSTIQQIYKEAGVATTAPPNLDPSPAEPTAPPPPTTSAPPPAPPASLPVAITSPSAGSSVSGISSVTADVNLTLDAAGSMLLVDGVERGLKRAASPPFLYQWNTTDVTNGVHVLQVSAHATDNVTSLSQPVTIVVSNGSAAPPPVDPPVISEPPTPTATYPINLTSPVSGQSVEGWVQVTATIPQTLDAAGSYLMIDGVEVGSHRVLSGPYVYTFDSSTIPKGQHVLQIWAHDISNSTLLSNAVSIIVR